jgi:hypothetical protein
VPRTPRILVPLLIALYIGQCFWFIRTQSFTNDEPEHLVAGLEAWRYGEFARWHDQPPLARLLFTLPLLRTDWGYHTSDDQVRPDRPAAEVWLHRSRPVNMVLGLALLLLIWFTASRLFSEAAATFALALAVLSPDLIAHFSLSTIDGAGTLLFFASVIQFVRWWRGPTRFNAVLLGLILGLFLLSKFNSPPIAALMVLLVLIRSNWRRAAAVSLIAAAVIWTGYFFHTSRVVFADGNVTIHFAGYTKQLVQEMPTLSTPITIFLPACEWMTGLGRVVFHDVEGHRAFLLGNYSTTGWKLYFPVAVLLKWPLIVLTLATAGVWLGRRLPGRRDLYLMTLFPAVYFGFAIFSRINIGVRHVLPVYPFVLLYAAAVWEWARGIRFVRALLIALVIAQAADIARYAPDYLSYFTVTVPSQNTWKLLSDSNTDWGQGMLALRQYQSEHPSESIYLAYVGEVDPAFYGIRYTRLGESDHPNGTVIVSAAHLSGQLLKDHYAYRWLLSFPRKAILNHTLYVFDTTRTPSINSADGRGAVAERAYETDIRGARQ